MKHQWEAWGWIGGVEIRLLYPISPLLTFSYAYNEKFGMGCNPNWCLSEATIYINM